MDNKQLVVKQRRLASKSEIDQALILLESFSADDKARILKKAHDIDRARSAVATSLMNQILRDLGCKDSIYRNEQGKPLVKSEFSVNASHDGSWVVACGIQASAQLGIDIVLKSIENLEALRIVLHQNELKILDSLEALKEKIDYIHTCFALKEAYTKAVGTGLCSRVEDLEFINVSTEQSPALVNSEFQFNIVNIDELHIMAIACNCKFLVKL